MYTWCDDGMCTFHHQFSVVAYKHNGLVTMSAWQSFFSKDGGKKKTEEKSERETKKNGR